MKTQRKRQIYSAEKFAEEISKGNKIMLAQAITLIESTLPEDRDRSQTLIELLLPKSGQSIRIGITGIPGVGKSTFIETFGKHLTGLGKKIAVLAIDPSSKRSAGSILGDKSRMEELSNETLAFIRPSPAGGASGGVADKTRETILLCEAAGYEIIIVETIGVGQIETAVKNMVDFFLLLVLAGAGDELQGIKRGIMELVDGIVVTKADGDNVVRAKWAQTELLHALHIFKSEKEAWTVPVILSSAIEKKGMQEIWDSIDKFRIQAQSSGQFEQTRLEQKRSWFHEAFLRYIRKGILSSGDTQKSIHHMESSINDNQFLPSRAAQQLAEKILKTTIN